jgi:hypothetical protein
MSIQQVTMFVAGDGEVFPTLETAEAHDAALAIEARIVRYVAELHGSDKAKGRAAGAVRRFLLWEANQTEGEGACHEP